MSSLHSGIAEAVYAAIETEGHLDGEASAVKKWVVIAAVESAGKQAVVHTSGGIFDTELLPLYEVEGLLVRVLREMGGQGG